ncbi:DUF1304 family protein [Occultella gossypii]|uniref:DUF1304 family protein n=1 Tax=Occultella gossypii TaxID=2800820 RepID=A0ABS7SA27_9MICO|nr:DUF1304 family protein [Occultella gossypii]MBZ2197192.1 DUF1304 family protein [Occultella gossypii]
MEMLAQVCAGLAALILIAVFPFEAFLIERPGVQKFLGIEPDGIRNVHLWSFCLGARNALAGAGTLVGIWMINYGSASTGATVVVVGCLYMLASALFMGLADLLGYWRPRGASIRGTLSSSVLPAAALVLIAL